MMNLRESMSGRCCRIRRPARQPFVRHNSAGPNTHVRDCETMGTGFEIILAKSSGRGCSLVVQVKSFYRIRIEHQWGQLPAESSLDAGVPRHN